MNSAIKPIFLFSLPRSGSTLVQRILASCEKISTTSEPWIMLPLLNARRQHGALADYGHLLSFYAIDDFIKNLPDQEATYRTEVKRFILRLYRQSSSSNAEYFLDKTPRYHLFADEIIKIFGNEARYIFLWRNPLAVIASINEYGSKKWNVPHYKVDIYSGLNNLVKTQQLYPNSVISINYENLIGSCARAEWENLFTYLDLDFSPDYLSEFSSVQLSGNAGDLLGMKTYNSISSAPLEKWKTVLANPIRKKWCKNYLKWIGTENLSAMGYKMDDLLSQLESMETSLAGCASDLGSMMYGEIRCFFSLRSIYYNIKKMPDFKSIISLEY